MRQIGFYPATGGGSFARLRGDMNLSGGVYSYAAYLVSGSQSYGDSGNHTVWIEANGEAADGITQALVLRAKYGPVVSTTQQQMAELKLSYTGTFANRSSKIEMKADALTFNGYNVALRDTSQTISGEWTFTGNPTLGNHYYHRMYSTNDLYVHYYPSGGNGVNYSRANLRVWTGSTFKTLAIGGNGTFTWDGATVWTSANDGPSTGLDADTIDTIDSSRIIYGQNSTGSTQKTDINWNAKSGFYSKTPGSVGGGAPSDTYYHIIEATYSGDSYYMMQFAQYFWSDALYHRRSVNNGTFKEFGDWVRIADDVSLEDGSHVDAYFTGHIMAGNTGLTDVGSVSATNWFRSKGNTGWYSQDYAGGIHMTDTTWIRTYNGKSFYCSAEMRSNVLSVNQSNGALGAWTAVTFGTGWANYGGGYVNARYRRFGDVVHVHGMVLCTNAGYGGIFNIPYQIAARYIYHPASSVQHQRVDAAPGSGYTSIQTVGGQVLNQWIMLDMIIPIY